MATTVDIEYFNISVYDIDSIYNAIVGRHPEYFYVSPIVRYSYYEFNSRVIELEFRYCFKKGELSARQAELDTAVNAAAAYAGQAPTQIGKILLLHEYITNLCGYDKKLYTEGYSDELSSTAYGCLVDGMAICQGYALAFQLVAQQLGIQAEFVFSLDMQHAWNIVLVNGTYYHVDCTSDDLLLYSGFEGENKFDLTNIFGSAHDYFLKTDAEMYALGFYGWESPYAANGRSISGFWEDAVNMIYYYDGSYYYLREGDNSSGELMQMDAGQISGAQSIYQFETVPWSFGKDANPNDLYLYDGYWQGADTNITFFENELYFNTANQIYRLNLDALEAVPVYNLPDETAAFAAIGVKDGYLCFNKVFLNQNGFTVFYTYERTYVQPGKSNFPNLMGDANGDGKVTVSDVMAVRQYVAAFNVTIFKDLADVSKDGKFTAADVMLLRLYNADLISSF